jgi:hypothetical protein
VRDVNDRAGTVARFGVAAAGAAVLEAFENFESLQDDLVTALTADVGYETDAAGVVLRGWVVQGRRSISNRSHRVGSN